MELKDQNILFFTRSMECGGTEKIVLQLCEVFNPLVNKIVVCSSGGVNEAILKRMGIRHYSIPDVENKTLTNIRKIRAELVHIIKEEKITIIHTHHRMTAFFCQLIRIPKSIALFNTSHTAFYDKRVLTHIAFHNFNMIACGEGVKKSLVKGLGFRAERVKVICNGIKADKLIEHSTIAEIQKAKNHGDIVFAVIGRISKEKGVEYLVKAIPYLKTKNILCVIVGVGQDEDAIKKYVLEQKIEDKIVFLGLRKDVLNILSQVDFLVQPSLQEGLPLTPIEAMSQGRPVIGTNIDGTSEIVENEVNGYLVPPADVHALAEAIDRMCMIDRTEYMEAAQRTYIEKYSFDVFAKNYIDFYKKMI